MREGAGPPELSEVHRDQLSPGRHEGGREPHERRQELQEGKKTRVRDDDCAQHSEHHLLIIVFLSYSHSL